MNEKNESFECESSLEHIQNEQKKWAIKNFGEQPPFHSYLGIVEELGELADVESKLANPDYKRLSKITAVVGILAHCELKKIQGIRKNEDHEAMAKDAIGDIMIYLIGYCNNKGYNLEDILVDTWNNVVSKRDWKKNPETGI